MLPRHQLAFVASSLMLMVGKNMIRNWSARASRKVRRRLASVGLLVGCRWISLLVPVSMR